MIVSRIGWSPSPTKGRILVPASLMWLAEAGSRQGKGEILIPEPKQKCFIEDNLKNLSCSTSATTRAFLRPTAFLDCFVWVYVQVFCLNTVYKNILHTTRTSNG